MAFKKKKGHLITYASGERTTQIDYILCRCKSRNEVLDCKVIPGESVAPQHRLVVGRICLGTKRKGERKCEPNIKWWKLKEETTREMFAHEAKNRLGSPFPNDWKETSGTIYSVAKEVLGVTSGRRKMDKETWWWNDEVQEAIKTKKEAWRKMNRSKDTASKVEYSEANKQAKRCVSKAKAEAFKTWYDDLETVDGQKNIFRVAKQRERAGRDIHHMRMIKDQTGKVLSNDDEIRKRWKNYFEKLMNVENDRERREEVLSAKEQTVEPISKEEVWEAVNKMKNGKAVGPDEIPVEVWKSLGDEGCSFLCELFNDILESESIPEKWRQSTLVPVYKNKGDVQSCENYRGIKLMCHTMKIWERVIDKRIRSEVEISEEQFGFMRGKRTTDPIFALRIMAEKYREKQKELHCVFIDLEKAYDRVPREEVWYCMRQKGVTEKYVKVVQDMYADSQTCVKTAVGKTDPFSVQVGLHQGSALSPLLFAIVMDALTDGIRRKAPYNMLYADDVVLVNDTKEESERELERWRYALEQRGLRVSRAKTEYLCIGQQTARPAIKIAGEEVQEASEFKYLGSTIQGDGSCRSEVKKRIQAGWNSWKKVSGVMCDKRMPESLKGKVYTSVVRPAMLYGLETVPLTKNLDKELETAEMRMLRWSIGVTRMDKVRNVTTRSRLNVESIATKARESRLRWFAHVKRRDDNYVGKQVLEMKVQGKGRRGRPKTRWMDRVRADMKLLDLEEGDALDRKTWRLGIQYGDPANCRIS